MELPPFNLEDFNKWKQSQSIVKECDMEDEMKIESKEHIMSGIEKCSGGDGLDVQAACKFIKENMDRQFGPSWHCIIGEGYSFEVTRQQNSSLLLYYAGVYAVLLFKC